MTDASKILSASVAGLFDPGPTPAVEAGTPSLNRHVPRTEAEVRCEAALKVAFSAAAQAKEQHKVSNALAVLTLATALANIIDILQGGKS
jgi:hypothetical protein